MQWLCASLPLFTHTRPLTHLHFELWSDPALCMNLCVTLYSMLMLENTSFRLCQINSFFTGYLSNYLSGFSYPQYIPSASCFVPSVLSLSPQKQKWFLGSFFQLFYCFLVRHHGISKEQRSLKNYLKWQNGCVDRILVFLCKLIAAHLYAMRHTQKCAAELGCKSCMPHPFHRHCHACSHLHRFFCLLECWLYVRAVLEDRNQNWDCMHGKTQ